MHRPVSKDFIFSNPDLPVRQLGSHPRGLGLFDCQSRESRLWTLVLAAALIACPSGPVRAQSATVTETLRREFVDHAFTVKSFGPARWLNEGQAYTTVEPSGEAAG